MQLNELERILPLQNKAYGLLLWLKKQARQEPDLLSPESIEALAHGDDCVEWIGRHFQRLPQEFRPKRSELKAFAYLLSSFFTTSFRVAETRFWDEVSTTLVVGAKKLRNARHKRHSERREREAADELKRHALKALADENGLSVSYNTQEEAISSPDIGQDLSFWTYGCELVRRSQFASQGCAVHRLWLELNEKSRKELSPERIWQSRERIVSWLANR
jgi:hypothetical protein